MLKANFEEMNQNAKEINQAANDYEMNVKNLYETVESLQDAWKGTDNLSYIETINGYKNDIVNLGKAVNNYAQFLSDAAAILEQTQNDTANAAGRL